MSKVTISQSVIKTLANFCEINKSIHIKPGNTISTISVNNNILAKAEVDVEFPVELPIYDLGMFISALKLFTAQDKLPVLLFDEKVSNKFTITQDGSRTKSVFHLADPSIIHSPPDTNIKGLDSNVTFSLDENEVARLRTAASSYMLPDFCVYSTGGLVHACVTDNKNSASNSFSIEVGKSDDEFCYCCKFENIKVLIQDYDITIANDRVLHFKSKNVKKYNPDNCEYWIALEPVN